jgi:pimeloyl-ACP methyl ester carboxylesterase
MSDAPEYLVRRPGRSRFVQVRGVDYHLHCWGDASLVHPNKPPLVLLHGWMDVGASFQFLVDELENTSAGQRFVVAPDWRGFGLTKSRAGPVDTYWFGDYLGDLEALLRTLADPGAPEFAQVDLAGHSMGGNVAMLYAGARPERIRRLVNLEGFGMPDVSPDRAVQRYRQWLDEVASPARLQGYDSLAAVARRLQRNDPLLPSDKAHWLARHWASETAPGEWTLRADPAHKHITPTVYRSDEAVAVWRHITAPLLWIEGDQTDLRKFWGDRYTRDEFSRRLACVPNVTREVVSPSGHMLHHDQPAKVAASIASFLAA